MNTQNQIIKKNHCFVKICYDEIFFLLDVILFEEFDLCKNKIDKNKEKINMIKTVKSISLNEKCNMIVFVENSSTQIIGIYHNGTKWFNENNSEIVFDKMKEFLNKNWGEMIFDIDIELEKNKNTNGIEYGKLNYVKFVEKSSFRI